MTKQLVFGDVVRIDPATNPQVPQPDNRRWMVISFDNRHKWTTLFLGPNALEWAGGIIAHWDSLYGFIEVEP